MQTTQLSDTKSILAKLLAGENLNVVHKRISTAMIDLKTRTLYVPIWEDMDSALYDLLMGHEVGHALNTPPEGWHSAIHDENGKPLGPFKGVLNICEDARIEKMIKRKYPGLSKSFAEGYKNLYNRDFFGIKDLKDLSKLNLIDRINLSCKIGSHLILPFSDEERELLREVENTETWEEVIAVAHKLFEKAKEDQDNQLNSLDDLTQELLDQLKKEFSEELEDDQAGGMGSMERDEDTENPERDSSPSSEKGEEDDEKDDEKGEGNDSEEDSKSGAAEELADALEDADSDEEGAGAGDEESEDDDSEEDKSADESKTGETGAGDESTGKENNEPESITDSKFRERERELISDSVEVYTYMLPKPALDRIIVPNSVYCDNFYELLNIAAQRNKNNYPIASTCAKRFGEKNNRYINLLVKEFEMRKNARQYARTTVAKTGELDMTKLHAYKYTNDLFKKISVVEKGKSHGMIMYVDMSGSMRSCFGATMEQTLILVAFCRKVGIPFDVYGFSDRRECLSRLIQKKKISSNFIGRKFDRGNEEGYTLSEDGFHLIHFISSQLQGNHYRKCFDAMAVIAMNWQNRLYPSANLPWDEMGLDMGGTPFVQTTMASRPMIERFKAENKVDITNVIYLTDGDGTGSFVFKLPYAPRKADGTTKIVQQIYMVDPKTKRRMTFRTDSVVSSIQREMTAFIRTITGCKHIGFYIADSRSVRDRMRQMSTRLLDEEATKAVEKNWRRDGYYQAPNYGYDSYYYVKSNDLDIADSDYKITEDMSTKKMAREFNDAQNDKRRHRVLVSKFAQDIAA